MPTNDPRAKAGRKQLRRYVPGPHILRRGKHWYAYLPDREPNPRVSLHTTDERAAHAKFRVLLERGGAPSKDPRPPESPLAEIADHYLAAPHGWTRRSLASSEVRALAFVRAMQARGVALPSEITVAVLDRWRTERMKTRSRATINRDEVVARRMLAWAAHPDRQLCDRTPLEGRAQLREVTRDLPPLIPSPREVARVVAALEDLAAEARAALEKREQLRASWVHGAALAIASALVSGCRLDELRHLAAADLHDGALHVRPETGAADDAWTTKGYRARAVPVGDDALGVVREFVAWRTSGKGAKGKPVGVADTWIADMIDAGCKRAGLDWTFRMHDLRRTFATENHRNGTPITVLRDWMGHRDTQTTERYLGRFRDDAAMRAATSPALAVFNRAPADVVPMKRKGGR